MPVHRKHSTTLISVEYFIPIMKIYIISSLLLVQNVNAAYYARDNSRVPCSFADSVNITSGIRLENGSFLHNGIVYPRHLVGEYNYEFFNLTLRRPAQKHLRGCICKLKTCIRSCCEDKTHHFELRNRTCTGVDYPINSDVDVRQCNDKYVVQDIFQTFGFVSGRPCNRAYYLEPYLFEEDKWELFENGSLLVNNSSAKIYNKDQYCMSPYVVPNATFYNITFAVCFEAKIPEIKDILYSYAMIFSIPFLIITILVYLIIPELRNLHGKSLVCYLITLLITFSIVSYFLIVGHKDIVDKMVCNVLGYIAYYFIFAGFLWLSVISFDLWWNFRGTKGINRLKEKKRFIIYSIYAWGVPLIFLGINMGVQESDLPEIYKSGIGGTYCYLDVHKGVQILYLYGPMLIVIIFNASMFIMTSLKIHHVQKEMARIMARKDSQRNLNKEKDRFGLFLRLFIVMGVTWTAELISWACELYDITASLFYVTDICNGIIGFIIFCLFVIKKKVKVLIVKRYRSSRGISDRTSRYSTKTTTSNITMTALTPMIATTPNERNLINEPLFK